MKNAFNILLNAVATIIILIICAVPAMAETDDGDNKISIEIPNGEGIYYYMAGNGNLFNDLQERLESDGRDIRLFVCRFTPDNEMAYSLTVLAVPFTDVFIGEDATPSAQTDDITEYTDEQKALISDYFTGHTETPLNLGTATDVRFGGLDMIMFEGNSQDGTDAYNMYAATDGNKLIMAETVYKPDTENNNLTELTALTDTLVIGDNAYAAPAAPPPSPLPRTESLEIITPEVTQTPEPIPTPTLHPTPAPTPSRNLIENILFRLKTVTEGDSNFKLYIGGAAALLAVLIVVIVCAKKKRGTAQPLDVCDYADDNTGINEEKNGADIIPLYNDDSSSLREEPFQIDTSDSIYEIGEPSDESDVNTDTSDVIKYNNATSIIASDEEIEKTHIYKGHEEDKTIAKNEEDKQLKNDAEFENDISKYTRQPGRDVNDISKNTIGSYSDTDELTIDIARATRTAPPAKPWKTEGTRMGRHKKKKK